MGAWGRCMPRPAAVFASRDSRRRARPPRLHDPSTRARDRERGAWSTPRASVTPRGPELRLPGARRAHRGSSATRSARGRPQQPRRSGLCSPRDLPRCTAGHPWRSRLRTQMRPDAGQNAAGGKDGRWGVGRRSVQHESKSEPYSLRLLRWCRHPHSEEPRRRWCGRR